MSFPGVYPLSISHKVRAAPRGVVFALFCSEMDTDFSHFGLESGIVFQGTRGLYERIYPSNSKWVRKKEKCANKEIVFVGYQLK